MDERTRELCEVGILRRGHFVLPNGWHSDTIFDRVSALENPNLFVKLISDLVCQTRLMRPDFVVGASPGGMIIGFHLAMETNALLYNLDFTGTTRQIDPGANIEGKRIVILEDFVYDARQYDDVVRIVRSRGAEVTGIAALIALPVREADLPVSPLLVATRLRSQVFPPDGVPESLAKIPIEVISDWRSG
jgi:orotate phosphoribosyltransferase